MNRRTHNGRSGRQQWAPIGCHFRPNVHYDKEDDAGTDALEVAVGPFPECFRQAEDRFHDRSLTSDRGLFVHSGIL